MQHKSKKSLQLQKALGTLIRTIREEKGLSCNKFANEYDLDSGNLSRIENAQTNCKFITAWKIADALGISFSDLAKRLEENLGKDFKLIDE